MKNKEVKRLMIAKMMGKLTFKQVADELSVSANTVTSWTKGKHQIKLKHEELLKEYLDEVER